jgi:hypothetical protein
MKGDVMEYLIQWSDEPKPLWQEEKLLKTDIPELIAQYWEKKTPSSAKGSKGAKKNDKQVSIKNCFSVLKPEQAAANKEDNQDEEEAESSSERKTSVFKTLELAFVEMQGNWRKSKRQGRADIYKCSDCDLTLKV